MTNAEDPRIQFYEYVETGKLSLQDTVRSMRKILKMTQPEYAKLVGVAPRIIIDLERGVGNPTLKTLEKIGHPFRLKINFRRLVMERVYSKKPARTPSFKSKNA